jgi:hypothetical protein
MIRSNSTTSLSVAKNLEAIQQCENNIIMFGLVGHGKTTLLNKACGTSFKTAESGFSCTRDIQFSYSIKGNMAIIDFPGLNSTKDTINHLKIQKNTLKVIPVRMICFVIKYDKRYDHLIEHASKMLSIFYNYKDNITIIITHSEDCSIVDKENIKAIFNDPNFSINNIIFTTIKKTSPLALCDMLEKLKQKMKNIPNMILQTRDFLASVKDIFDFSVMDERNKYQNEFDDTLKQFKAEFKKANDDDLKRAIYFAFKDYKEDLIERYSKIVRQKKADNNSIITEVIVFNNIIFNKFNDFRIEVQNQIKLQTNNYNNEFNKFKRCPHCGQIWFKIKGCDSMVCGRRSTLKDKICGRFKNYIVEYIGRKIKIICDEKENKDFGNDSEIVGLTEEEKQKNIILEREGKTKISPVGCGKNFKWNDNLVDDCTEEIVRKLNEISVSDYDSGVRQIADNLGEKEL